MEAKDIRTEDELHDELFKAGEEKGYAHARQHCEDVIIPQVRQEARQEVVDWVNTHTNFAEPHPFSRLDWQDFLKGIEK